MSETNPLRINLKKYAPMILIPLIVSLLVSSIVVYQFVQPLYEYDDPPPRLFDVKMSLRVEYFTEPTEWYFFDEDQTQSFEDIVYNNVTQKITVHTYLFELTDLNLTATFSFVYVVFNIEKDALPHFDLFQGYWRVEDKEAFVNHDDFQNSMDGSGSVFAEVDITSHMWRDIPPNALDGSIKLFSR